MLRAGAWAKTRTGRRASATAVGSQRRILTIA
jgi:hypothetical protein